MTIPEVGDYYKVFAFIICIKNVNKDKQIISYTYEYDYGRIKTKKDIHTINFSSFTHLPKTKVPKILEILYKLNGEIHDD